MWNTGCANIQNDYSSDIYCMDMESLQEPDGDLESPLDLSTLYVIAFAQKGGGGGKFPLRGGTYVIFPWCIDDREIKEKAFRFLSPSLPDAVNVDPENCTFDLDFSKTNLLFYMFQDYNTNRVCYSTTGLWSDRQEVFAPSSNLTIFITPAGIPRAIAA